MCSVDSDLNDDYCWVDILEHFWKVYEIFTFILYEYSDLK